MLLFLLLCVNLYSQNFTDQLNAGDDEPTIWEGWGAAVMVRGVGDYTVVCGYLSIVQERIILK